MGGKLPKSCEGRGWREGMEDGGDGGWRGWRMEGMEGMDGWMDETLEERRWLGKKVAGGSRVLARTMSWHAAVSWHI